MSVPRLVKVTVNMGVGEASRRSNVIDDAIEELATITGQRPSVRRARKSIAAFKLREGMPVGAAVTLRKARMWEFLDRLVSISIPRIRDFRGLNPRSFDGRGNYSLGVREQLIFPEIDYDSISETRGLDIAFATTAEERRGGLRAAARARLPVRAGGPARRQEPRGDRGRGGGAAQGGGAPARRGRAGRPRAAQGREPRGLREARARRDEEGEDGDGESTARTTEKKRSNGEDLTTRQAGCGLEVQGPQLQPLPQVRPLPRRLPQVRPLPDLPARGRPQGLRPRHDQVELVGETRCSPTQSPIT